MDTGSLLLGLALLIVVAAFVLRPLVEKSGARVAHARSNARENGTRAALLRQRDAIYAAIRELDFDFRLGKISEEDYHPQRERLALQGVAILKQLDALSPDGDAGLEGEIEAEIARRRRKRTGPSGQTAPARQAGLSDAEIEAQIRALRRKSATSPVASACPRCGATTSPEDHFCRNCGAALGSQGASVLASEV
ncbi:MAG: hypothetical protein C4310_05135 [Chloroflexota bacterium]